ncbi:hypothetical protein BCR37DRAFT_71164 [Protomyces lactucae-debilis]|uniref:Yeast cell wall synthesis Kre9/Knh1-like N-terminal domain-containing protein n=1 Tax=Protomyces lactucae-debilis TaxID=2754530 RepID=A0A1Y2F9C2_PROLT|nr:uncharacterized protein BCR37DRAFT_71164 [Protomyces lactucae-debilis]ORY80489.1 hypothetical protein BCR37DRAFT_71164 [Protomyces lactucae-debilis]
MMRITTLLFTAFFTLLSSVLAIQVTSPSQGITWTVGSTAQITWSSVSTDPTTVDVYLVNFSRYPNSIIMLKSNVAVSGGSLAIDGTYLQPGTGWQVNLVPQGSNSQQILAQSNQFTIAAGGAAGQTPTAATGTVTAAAVAPIVTNGNATAAGGGAGGVASVPRVSASSAVGLVQVPLFMLGAAGLLLCL